MKDKGVKCDTCKFKFLDGVRCVIDPVKCGSYKPKSDKVLGDAIFACVGCPNKFCCDIRDTHTRSEIAKRLKKITERPDEVGFSCSIFREDFDRLIKELEGK